jgi:hypothetical protein
MTLFHLKINKILNYPSGQLLFEVQYPGIDQTKEFKCSGIRSRTISKIWDLSIPNFVNKSIEIIAKTKKFFHQSVELGRMKIPLGMMKPNSVLNDWFLIRKRSVIDVPLLIELSLHCNYSNQTPFSPYPLQLASFYDYQPPDPMFICGSRDQANDFDCIPIYDQSNNSSQHFYPTFENY